MFSFKDAIKKIQENYPGFEEKELTNIDEWWDKEENQEYYKTRFPKSYEAIMKNLSTTRKFINIRKGVIMETKTALEMFVEEDVRYRANFLTNCKGYLSEQDEDDLSEWRFAAVLEYYEDDKIPTKEELEYLDKLEFNFTEFAAHYEVVTLDEPDGEICTVDSTCDIEEALKWYNEEINGYVYIQLVDHDSMLIEVLKCNF